jgi:hypothetical protein
MAFSCAKCGCLAIQLSRPPPSRPLPDVPFYSRLAEPEMLLSHAHRKGQCVRVPIQPIFGGAEFLRSLGRREQPIAVRTWLRLLAGEQPTEQERVELGDLAA